MAQKKEKPEPKLDKKSLERIAALVRPPDDGRWGRFDPDFDIDKSDGHRPISRTESVLHYALSPFLFGVLIGIVGDYIADRKDPLEKGGTCLVPVKRLTHGRSHSIIQILNTGDLELVRHWFFHNSPMLLHAVKREQSLVPGFLGYEIYLFQLYCIAYGMGYKALADWIESLGGRTMDMDVVCTSLCSSTTPPCPPGHNSSSSSSNCRCWKCAGSSRTREDILLWAEAKWQTVTDLSTLPKILHGLRAYPFSPERDDDVYDDDDDFLPRPPLD